MSLFIFVVVINKIKKRLSKISNCTPHYQIASFEKEDYNNNKIAVTVTAQPNKANLCNLIPGHLIFNTVHIKFIAPNKLLIPERCRANIARSTLGPL